jgi:hypothetical protein
MLPDSPGVVRGTLEVTTVALLMFGTAGIVRIEAATFPLVCMDVHVMPSLAPLRMRVCGLRW